MDWNALKVFLAIQEEGNLARAARRLGVSYATVYRSLNSFEKSAGARLFERLSGNYELTELGEEMLVLARRVAAAVDDIDRHVIGKDQRPQGRVKLTAPASFSYDHLPRHLHAFRQQCPEIDVELLVTNTELNMSSRQADIALRVTSSPPEHLLGRRVCQIAWGIYASPSYLREMGTPVGLADLGAHRFIGAAGVLKQHAAYARIERKLTRQIVCHSDDLVAMAKLATAGHGLALLPDDLATPGIRRLFTFEPGGVNELWVLTHPDLRNVERIQRVMRFLTTVLTDAFSLGRDDAAAPDRNLPS